MIRLAQLSTLTFAILAASPLVASASHWTHHHYPGCGHDSYTPPPPPPPPPPTTQAPELDPSAAGSALALLAGGALLIRERRRSFAR